MKKTDEQVGFIEIDFNEAAVDLASELLFHRCRRAAVARRVDRIWPD